MSYKVKIQDLAEMMAGDDGYEYVDLSPSQQDRYYKKALEEYYDNLADVADLRRKGEADGGMMRKNYAMGSDEDMPPEVEEIPTDEYLDLLKQLGANEEQASGIRSLDKRMASDDANERLLERIYEDLLDQGMSPETAAKKAMEMFRNMEGNYPYEASERRKAPSIKMAEYRPGDYDPILIEEYDKYVYDMLEQGMQPMPMEDYIKMIVDEARLGVRAGGITSIA